MTARAQQPDPRIGRAGGASDAALVARVLSGGREAYSTLVRRYQTDLYRYARAMGLDHDTALDHVQEAFIRGYTQLHRCRQPASFRVWLLRILRHRCLDDLKSVRRRTVPIESVSLAAPMNNDRCDSSERVGEAMRALPPLLREAFILKHRDGRSYDEISSITGASISALKMRVQRAREALRSALEDTVYETGESRAQSM